MTDRSIGRASRIVIEATVIRADGRTERLGRVAYWHRNPVRRIAGRIAIAWRRILYRASQWHRS